MKAICEMTYDELVAEYEYSKLILEEHADSLDRSQYRFWNDRLFVLKNYIANFYSL